MAKKYNFFVEDFETPKAELGSGFIQSYLGGGVLSKGFAIATERRVYFKGKSYFKDYKGHWKKQMQEKTVDLKDITGTGYTSMRQLWMLITGIASFFWYFIFAFFATLLCDDSLTYLFRSFIDYLPGYIMFGIIPLGIFLVLYKLKRRTLFSIEFAGGNISFNTSWYGKAEVDKFQMDLRKAMAEVKDTPVPQATVQVQTVQSKDKAGTLREYAKLKDDGIITDDEFQKMKSELLASTAE